MEQIYFGERIAMYRKARGLTQESLAQKLGITNQAVSKWESDQNCPDIMLFPLLADEFGVSIDELFGRSADIKAAAHDEETPTVISGLPWPDDNDLRAVCYVGHRLSDYHLIDGKWHRESDYKKSDRKCELHFSGTVRDIRSYFDVIVKDSLISRDVYAGDSINCGDIGGSVTAGDSVSCSNVGGNVSACDSVRCGEIHGNADAGDSGFCGDNA